MAYPRIPLELVPPGLSTGAISVFIPVHDSTPREVMEEVEPQLDDKLHAQVTKLLCELSAFNIMQMMHTLDQARSKTRFQG